MNHKRAGEHDQHLIADSDFFCFRISNGFRLKRPGPGQLQGNQKFILWFVAVDVKAGHHRNSQGLIGARAVFEHERVGRCDDDLILLGRSAYRREAKER